MSGTSADGVDVAIVRIEGIAPHKQILLLRHHFHPYPATLRHRIFAARERGAIALAELASLARDISLCYATAVKQATSGFGPLDAVAAHGQTLFHAPPLTIQWIDPALLAYEAATAVISDFRRADCAAGGQGAPLVPYADQVLFRHAEKTRIALNIGGIANLTFLPPHDSVERVIAFDTGPGNCISDALVRPDADCDTGGERAARGKTLQPLLERAMADPYFKKPPPKSTDGPAMIALYPSDAKSSHALDDLLHTACELTARTIASAIRDFCPGRCDELIASGGGIHNATLMRLLHEHLPDVPIFISDDLGVPSAAKEAIAFALLGAAALDGEPANLPWCTGASQAVILGSITPNPLSSYSA